MKGMNRNSQHPINSIIHSRIVLYVILFASLINMTAYGLMGDIMTPLVFILVGTIIAYYNKNMIVILVVALAFSNIVKYGSQMTMNAEGFTEGLPTTGGSKSGEDGTSESKSGGDNKTLDTSSNLLAGVSKSAKDTKPTKSTKESKNAKYDENAPTMTNEQEEESLKEFEEMKNKIVEIVDAVEINVGKINKKMNDLQNKIKLKEKEAYTSSKSNSS